MGMEGDLLQYSVPVKNAICQNQNCVCLQLDKEAHTISIDVFHKITLTNTN